jgi:hypothetical protein
VADEQFAYRTTGRGDVFVSWRGRDVTTLRARAATRFLLHADGASAERVQELLRRATGNFKHGNER